MAIRITILCIINNLMCPQSQTLRERALVSEVSRLHTRVTTMARDRARANLRILSLEHAIEQVDEEFREELG